MGAPVVVFVDEFIDEILKFGDAVCGWPCGQPFLHGLLEPFDFAGRGGMVGSSVFLGDAEFGESGFDAVASALPASESSCVDEAVVGEHRRWESMVFNGFVKRVDNNLAGDPPVAANV